MVIKLTGRKKKDEIAIKIRISQVLLNIICKLNVS